MRKQTTEEIQALIESRETLQIVSGEGTSGNCDAYTGKRTVRAVQARLTKERCNGDRWARVDTLDGLFLMGAC